MLSDLIPHQRGAEPAPAIANRAATRHLCAGVHTDRKFRDRVLGDVYADPRRRVAPSHGFDIIPVIRHAWRARWLELGQCLAIAAILAYTFVHAPVAAVAVVGLLSVWRVGQAMQSWVRRVALYLRERQSISQREHLSYEGKILGLGFACAVLITAGASLLSIGALGRTGSMPWIVRGDVRAAIAATLAIAVVTSARAGATQHFLNTLHAEGVEKPDTLGKRLSVVDKQQHHPVTVFGSFKPFIGSGVEVRTWSFAQRLVKPRTSPTESTREFTRPPFRTEDLVERLRRLIRLLVSDEDPETRLPNLTVKDHVYVDGVFLGDHRQLLIEDPSEQKMVEVMRDPSQAARHQLACRVESWGGEVFTSVFVHVSLQGRTLYLEFSTYALTPTRREYQKVDEIGGTGTGAMMRAIASGVLGAPAALTGLARLRHLPRWLVEAAVVRRDRTHEPRRGVNVGTVVSIREVAAREIDGSYFQFRDVLKHSKIIERRLLAAVSEFLSARNVDVSEFEQRATAILNHGVMVTGGEVKIEGSAIGVQASVNPPPPAPGGSDV